RSAVKKSLEALKRNEIVFILGEHLKRGQIETRLFGQKVPSSRGPVSLALRSGAAVVPMYLIRNYDGGLHLVIEPEMVMSRNGSLFQDITDNTKQIVRYLEDLIRRYPDQWNWLTVRMRKRRAQLVAQRSSR
ncbi:MAG: lysophospholipid acyltransferase family protein, partial [Deltaproteobacteria bacterium]